MGNNGVTNGAVSIAVGETSGKASKGVAKYSAGAGMAQAEQRAGGAMSEIGKAKQVGGHRIISSSSSYYSHFYVGSMFDDVPEYVARSDNSSPDSPFSFISPPLSLSLSLYPTIFS